LKQFERKSEKRPKLTSESMCLKWLAFERVEKKERKKERKKEKKKKRGKVAKG